MHKKNIMRIICFALILLLCLGFFPSQMQALAAEIETESETGSVEQDLGTESVIANTEDTGTQTDTSEEVHDLQNQEQEQQSRDDAMPVPPLEDTTPSTSVSIITSGEKPQPSQAEATTTSVPQAQIVVTLQPVSTEVNEGSDIRIEAAATGYSSAKWLFTDPEGEHVFSAANMFDGIDGISVSTKAESGKEILEIRNAPAELHGWSVRCEFYAEGNISTSSDRITFTVHAVNSQSNAETDNAEQKTIDKESEEAPGFVQSKKLGNVTVTITAPLGTFADGAKISVKRVSLFDRSNVEKAVEDARDEKATVVESYAFDIKVVDDKGNELQPAEGKPVEVSFTLERAEDRNLNATVYHISDGEATALETRVDADEKIVKAVTDGFSYYQVEFTYGELQYILPGNTSVPLKDILQFLGLDGEINEATSSNSEFFSIVQDDKNIWVVTARRAFDSTEKLTIKLNGIEYVIKVTDASYTVVTNQGFTYANYSWIEGLSLYVVKEDGWRSFTPQGVVQCYSINNVPVYCVEPDRNISQVGYENNNWQYPMNGAAYSATQRDLLALVMACGYPNGSSGQDQIYERAATQMMVWNVVCGMMTEGSVGGIPVLSPNSAGFYFGEPSSCFNNGHPIRSAFVALWDRIYAARVVTVGVPTWATANGAANNVLTLQYNSSSGLYEGTWTDTSGNFQYYNFSGSPVAGLTITQSGSTLSVTASPDVVASQNLGSVQTYFLRTASRANVSASTSNIIQFKTVQANGNIDWNTQTLQYYSASSGQISYPQAYLAIKANVVPLGHKFTITKTSTTSATSGNTAYSLANAVYGVYSDSACASELERITTDANGNATTANAYAAGTYYVKEILPSPGYLLDSSIHALTLAADGTLSGNTAFTEAPINSKLSLIKTSGKPDITIGNSCYTLAGAQYAVYASGPEANADTNRLEVLTTDEDGNAISTQDYLIGTYFVKEIVAAPGYMLDTTVHAVTVDSDGSVTGNSFTEEPGSDPDFIRIRKISSSGGVVKIITSSSAVFKVEFFGNDSWSGSPMRTWYYKTINGSCDIGDETYLDSSRPNSDRWYDVFGGVTYPVGTVIITEVESPKGYIPHDAAGGVLELKAKISQVVNGGDAVWAWVSDSNNYIGYTATEATLENEHRNGTIELTKKDPRGNPLAGVTYLLEYSIDSGATWAPTYKIAANELTDYGACKSQDMIDGRLTTGADGKIVFEGLMADREIQYRLTEISTPDGYSLLSSPVYVGSLPIETTALGIADTEEIEGTTYCYTLIFDVTDHSRYSLPSTGGYGFWQIPVVFLAVAAGIVFILHRKPRFS